MSDLKSVLSGLCRPRLLVRAARHGLAEYNRSRDLQRIAGHAAGKTSHSLVEHLIEREEQLEENRKKGDGSYSIARHIEVLVALMAECRLLPRNQRV